MDTALRAELVAAAREYVHGAPPYTFTELEQRVLRPFFSNVDKKVFFIQRLPESVCAALLAMYSRLKNPRGLRGHFVDHLVPLLMYEPVGSEPTDWREVQEMFKRTGQKTLNDIVAGSGLREHNLEMFLRASADPDYWNRIAMSGRISSFLGTWLDTYGHNSIARPAQLVFGVEDVSILAAKSLEWGRPGAGYIELSTRYVDFSVKATYPVERELALLDERVARNAQTVIDRSIAMYQELMGEKSDGPFPMFLRERWSGIVPDADLKSGAFGEACDVLGNLLPCATLTSLGVSVSGEQLPELIKHLILDDTPENDALAELIVGEANKVGAGYFIRHVDVSAFRRAGWSYLRPNTDTLSVTIMPEREFAESQLFYLLASTEEFRGCESWSSVIGRLCAKGRSPFDKLPRAFEHVSATFGGTMSFRGWRDLHRQGFCTHHRSLVTPVIGFYDYPKPAPPALREAFQLIEHVNEQVYGQMQAAGVSPTMRQYAMAMGNLVTYLAGANLRQWEFCTWQRTKGSVNDEVRQEFLEAERELRAGYPWWERLSRADLTGHYVFARGSKLVPFL